jgi:uncharacterized surface protein with fasciclin (FAS1) repeats
MNFRFSVYTISFFLLLIFAGCEQEFDKYYKVPDNLIGTVLDVLKEDGNYRQFCKALELADYDDIIGKTGNFTVFAPNDSAFQEFFRVSGYASLDDIPEEELRSIVMYHIVFWSYSKYKLLYGLGIEDENSGYSTDNFRKETKYRPPVSSEADSAGRLFNVYHDYKFLSVFSSEYFGENNLDASNNYGFLYPGSVFTGFHVDNSSIREYDIPAQNGWIHKIDKVLVPADSHEQLLKKHPEFSDFKALLDKRASFIYDDISTRQQNGQGDINDDGKLDSLFRKNYKLNSVSYSLDMENIDGNGQNKVFTLFAPTNSALQRFLSERTTGYSSFADFDNFWMNWYLGHYIGYNYWPSQLSAMTKDWPMPLTSADPDCNISPEEIEFSKMASNGPFYGINTYLLPKDFETAAGPVFGNKDYSWFCELLIFYTIDVLLNNEDIRYTVFAPTNAAMASAGYSARDGLGGFGLYHSQNPLSPVIRSRAVDLIKSHIISGELDGSDFEAGTFIKTLQNTYLGITEEGIYGGGDIIVSKVGSPETGGSNGIVYPLDKMLISPSLSMLNVLADQAKHPEFQEFFKLLQQSGLILLDDDFNYTLLSNLATGVYYTCMVPTNQAILDGISSGSIPADPEALRQFLRYYFIEGSIFSDGKNSGNFKTTRYADDSHNNYSTLEIINSMNDLEVRDHQGNVSKAVSGNIMTTNGVIHQLESLLFY